MRLGRLLSCVLFAWLTAVSIGYAAERFVTSTKGAASCKERQFDAVSAHEESERHCIGPAGFGIRYFDVVTRAGIAFTYRGKNLPGDELTWNPAMSSFGSHVEWVAENGQPSAAIFARWRGADDHSDAGDRGLEELIIVKLSPKTTCVVAIIGGLTQNAMITARKFADVQARDFRCQIDKPVTRVSASDDVSTLQGRLERREVFDHNGSIVELTRSRSGVVEILYLAPRTSLSIPAGTLLFRGAERNGVLSGDAYVFKDGCKPAPYAVSGKRAGIHLVMEGIAPQRGKGCAVIGRSRKSGHSRLVFERDPVLNVTDSVRQEMQTQSLDVIPLQRGYYVSSQYPCSQASNAIITLFDGESLGHAHQECKRPSIQKISQSSFRITESCRTTQVDNASWGTETTMLEIKSRVAFVATTPAGNFSYRYCKQSDLPDPWSDTDLGRFLNSSTDAASLTSAPR